MYWTKWALVGMVLILAGCGPDSSDAPKAATPESPLKVRALRAETATWTEVSEAPGTVRARMTAVISSRAMGYLRELRPQPGDAVAANEVVARIEAREFQVALEQARTALTEARSGIPEADSSVRAAEAQLELADVTAKRMQDLLDKRSVSRQEFDEARARLNVARANREMAQARRLQLNDRIKQAEQSIAAAEVQLSYLEIRAPFSGRVVARRAEPGMLASPGMALLEVESNTGYRLEVPVPEAQLRELRRGQSVPVALEGSAGPVSGLIDEITPLIDPTTRTGTVKIALPARPGAQGGAFGRALFPAAKRCAILIPRSAIIEQGELRGVWALDQGKARWRLLRLGSVRGESIEVLAGLQAGQEIAAGPTPGLSDGRPIEVAQ